MSCLGVHFALTEKAVAELVEIPDEADRIAYVQETEETFLSDHGTYAAESDKSWDAMHRLLSDGSLTWDGGEYPLNHVVLAGRPKRVSNIRGLGSKRFAGSICLLQKNICMSCLPQTNDVPTRAVKDLLARSHATS